MISPEISNFLQERIDAGDFPSAVYLVAEKGEIVFQDAIGHAVVTPKRIEAKTDTIYDLASLTKVLVTGLLIAKMLESNKVSLESRLGSLLNLNGTRIADLSIRELITHTSGLAAWRPFYLLVDLPQHVIRQISVEGPSEITKVVYSDLNFVLLQAVLEVQSKTPLAVLAEKELFSPLGLSETCFDPSRSGRSRIAASEFGNEHEKRTCREMGYKAPDDKFRDYQIWGEVHDGNAWFMDGAAGHAGLFSTAEEVFKIALQFLPEHTTLLKPETCTLFRTNFTEGMNEARSFAFELAETPGSTAGPELSPESFGHLGFTGTSLWIDPIRNRIFILLTNRTHNHTLPFTNINSVRRQFHNLANKALNVQK